MQSPPLDPPISDLAPTDRNLTGYDQQHLVTHLRLLDADAEGEDWREVAKIVLHIDPKREPDRAKRAWESHLARAKWLMEDGYRHLLGGGVHRLRGEGRVDTSDLENRSTLSACHFGSSSRGYREESLPRR